MPQRPRSGCCGCGRQPQVEGALPHGAVRARRQLRPRRPLSALLNGRTGRLPSRWCSASRWRSRRWLRSRASGPATSPSGRGEGRRRPRLRRPGTLEREAPEQPVQARTEKVKARCDRRLPPPRLELLSSYSSSSSARGTATDHLNTWGKTLAVTAEDAAGGELRAGEPAGRPLSPQGGAPRAPCRPVSTSLAEPPADGAAQLRQLAAVNDPECVPRPPRSVARWRSPAGYSRHAGDPHGHRAAPRRLWPPREVK